MLPNDPHVLVVVVECTVGNAELVSDLLWSLGAGAIEERASGTVVELRSSFGDDHQAVSDHLAEHLVDVGCTWRLEEVDPTVSERWRSFVGTTLVDDLISVRPSWIMPSSDARPIELVIEPGSTFGLGNHPTSVASIRALRRGLRPGDAVLDVGTGSGVLAIAAVRLGAAHAHGVDITPASLQVVADNAARNSVAGRVSVSTSALASLNSDRFDVVVANILGPTLIELAPELVRLTGRLLVLSGLLVERYEHVLEHMHPLRLEAVETVDGWVALSLVR